ncbi:tetratricopeptide repeat protein [Chitinimonas sp.]|uniref:tetratricopeptide repeat protein n=1 Tax=Chitinimonas sp. TaxID=1934313 RepID=UPI0035B36C02
MTESTRTARTPDSMRGSLKPIVAVLMALGMQSLGFAAGTAEIVSLIGRGEARPTARDDWKPARVHQTLEAGYFVRTGDLSQMAVLLSDQTQLRLNQNSILQIKEVSAKAEPTKLELVFGRVWTQAKRRSPGEFAVAYNAPAVTVQTPNAIAAIRGTDWELNVDKEGASTLTVLSGEVELSNDLGKVTVGKNEQGRVENGKAPSKTLLTNARERVQWVTAYRPQGRRWLESDAVSLQPVADMVDAQRYPEAQAALEQRSDAAASILLADLYLYQGRVDDAIKRLQPLAGRPKAAALLARAYLIADRAADAGKVLEQAPADDVEVQLARAEVARFNGDAVQTRAALDAARQQDGNSSEAWFGLGRFHAEREAVAPGRAALAQALLLNPQGQGYRGELGTLATFANDFAEAERAFKEALDAQPDDYVAWTGLGVLQLKQGKTEDALQSFLKAGVLEPRYARASLYTGVAYYQLGKTYRAEESLKHAMEQDPTDPLPHMMMSLIAVDRLDFGAATQAARQAARLMPYLKSLNQLLNNQKGNANVGAALAGFGLEEWAEAIAHEAYNPYWAGSALFLADRYSGEFNKNSELFKGFLTDPTVFGAGNRNNSLISTPGHNLTIGLRTTTQEEHETEASAVLNGYSIALKPIAYYLGLDYSDLRPGSADLTAHTKVATLGLGARPNYETGLFGFANSSKIDATLTDLQLGFIRNPASIDNRRVDGGVSYRFAPDSQLWIKAGHGSEDVGLRGVYYSPDIAATYLREAFVEVNPTGVINHYASHASQDDVQLRQVIDFGAHRLSVGFERGKQDKRLDSDVAFAPIRNRLVQQTRYESKDAYIGEQYRSNTWLLQADLNFSRFEKRETLERYQQFGKFREQLIGVTRDDRDIHRFDPRLGFAFTPQPGNTIRFAYQAWRKPASVASLTAVDTAGIALDDRLTSIGGSLKRTRLQFEWQPGGQTFAQFYADHRQVDNPNSPSADSVADLNLQDLQRLRNRNRLSLDAVDLLEDAPEFTAGRVNGVGFAVNHIVSDRLTLAARAQHNQSRNTSDKFAGKLLPWVPRNLLMLEASWIPMSHWQLGAQAIYRSSRFTDEENKSELSGGWGAGLRSYWESEDKRWSVEAIAENLYAKKDAAAVKKARLGLQALYRY